MKSIIIIIPYFGNFPDYFELFLKSCKYNETIVWAIITDNELKYDYPSNVHKIKSSFIEIQKKIHAKFDFEVVIDSVHKLCEYKPAYAYLFPELVKGYDYWGYGDLDLIYGNLREFLTPEILNYSKVFTLGHFTLIENTDEYNSMFMAEINGEAYYRKAFSSSENFNFDEQFKKKININTIFEVNKCDIWKRNFAADIYTKSSDLRLDLGDGKKERKSDSLFVWDNGKLIRYTKGQNGKINTKEYMYIHLQKRKMKCNVDNSINTYKIIPNSFEKIEIDITDIEKQYSKIKKKNFNLQYFKIRTKNLISKIKSSL